MPNPTIYLADDENEFVEERTDDKDPAKPSFSGYIRSLIQERMDDSDAGAEDEVETGAV